MTVELDALVVSLRADTGRFRTDIAKAQSALRDLQSVAEKPNRAIAETNMFLKETNDILKDGLEQSFQDLENTVRRFVETGKLSFSDLRETALSVLADIAAAAVRALLPDLSGPASVKLPGLVANLAGFPGRATGGPVSPDRPYIVGEQGPELFVPRGAGEVLPNRPGNSTGGALRPINITVNVNGQGDASAMRESGTQIALSVRRALTRAERFS